MKDSLLVPLKSSPTKCNHNTRSGERASWTLAQWYRTKLHIINNIPGETPEGQNFISHLPGEIPEVSEYRLQGCLHQELLPVLRVKKKTMFDFLDIAYLCMTTRASHGRSIEYCG